jgi:hypothetical protein
VEHAGHLVSEQLDELRLQPSRATEYGLVGLEEQVLQLSAETASGQQRSRKGQIATERSKAIDQLDHLGVGFVGAIALLAQEMAEALPIWHPSAQPMDESLNFAGRLKRAGHG